MNFQIKEQYTIEDLVEIVQLLRAPDGCPWDREQTHESIRRNFLEEAYEVAEAIDEGNAAHLQEELGDVLLQVVFHTEIEREKQVFDITDVADGVCKKLIYRHPHIFSTVEVASTEEVLQNWDALKRVEKRQETVTDTMQSVARSLPQLLRADKIQGKAKKSGFDWDDVQGAMDKVREETEEVSRALAGEGDAVEEIGDLLFAVVNVARFLKADPEQALEQANDKFIARFAKMEALAAKKGTAFDTLSLQEMEQLWQTVKAKEGK